MNYDKPASELSMKNFANEGLEPHFQEDEYSAAEEDFPIVWDEKFNNKLKAYNKTVTELDPLYSTLSPRSKILVRVFTKELVETKDGVIIPNTQRVPIQTQAGHGTLGEVENPWTYSTKAVVVGVPEFIKDLQPGDLVQLGEEPTRGVPLGAGHGAMIVIPNAYTHYDCKEMSPPVEPDDQHYGYLLVESRFIEMKLPNE